MATTDISFPTFSNGEFFQKTLDCLRSHIAILDPAGTIIAVNATWLEFATSNGLAEQFCGPGANYLRACDTATGDCSGEARVVAQGIRDVVAGKRDYFRLEYPCHSPTEQRWFSVRITRFETAESVFAVVTHDNITQRVMAEIGVQEANCRLEQLAATDALTGIANRRTFDNIFAHEWERHKRTKSPMSAALVDVDCFKLFNDHQGHLAGDECLQQLARAMQAAVGRASDLVARYGGEEFAVVLPTTNQAGASRKLRDVLRRVRELAIAHPHSKVGGGIVTVSIGCATVVPEENVSAAAFLARVDRALYEAKDRGRDQLVCAE